MVQRLVGVWAIAGRTSDFLQWRVDCVHLHNRCDIPTPASPSFHCVPCRMFLQMVKRIVNEWPTTGRTLEILERRANCVHLHNRCDALAHLLQLPAAVASRHVQLSRADSPPALSVPLTTGHGTCSCRW
jgi:hypothetical protein